MILAGGAPTRRTAVPETARGAGRRGGGGGRGEGGWRQGVEGGGAACQRDGLDRRGPAPAGRREGRGTLYDQGFVLLALARAGAALADPTAEDEAAALLGRLEAFAEP